MSEVRITRLPRRGMLVVRGDLASAPLRDVCAELTETDFPDVLKATGAGDAGLCWMSPDELLVMVPFDQRDAALDSIKSALQGTHFMVENVSDARAVFAVEGAHSREVMAKNCPVDLHPAHFRPGDFRRTRLGQVAAAFRMTDAQSFEVICFASVADYVLELLEVSAAMGPVGHF